MYPPPHIHRDTCILLLTDVHEQLRSKLCDLYENDAIFDKFQCSFSGDAKWYVVCVCVCVCVCLWLSLSLSLCLPVCVCVRARSWRAHSRIANSLWSSCDVYYRLILRARAHTHTHTHKYTHTHSLSLSHTHITGCLPAHITTTCTSTTASAKVTGAPCWRRAAS
jgi:hypothetical protein